MLSRSYIMVQHLQEWSLPEPEILKSNLSEITITKVIDNYQKKLTLIRPLIVPYHRIKIKNCFILFRKLFFKSLIHQILIENNKHFNLLHRPNAVILNKLRHHYDIEQTTMTRCKIIIYLNNAKIFSGRSITVKKLQKLNHLLMIML